MHNLFTPHMFPGICGNTDMPCLPDHRPSGADRAISPGARQTVSLQAW